MSLLTRILTYALGLFLVSSGIAKFTGGHVFAVIEAKSGVGLFDPLAGHVTGLAEIVAGALVLVGSTRVVGSALSAAIMIGAVGFHMSPWLGVATPVGFADGAHAPWTSADFTDETTIVPFVLAVVVLIGSVLIIRRERRLRRGAPQQLDATRDNAAVSV
jgi:uncharacterized membrane protein YphA (DoxX/SURF4 family)